MSRTRRIDWKATDFDTDTNDWFSDEDRGCDTHQVKYATRRVRRHQLNEEFLIED